MEILGSIPSKGNPHKISKRCLRCFDEQQWYAKNFLLKFIGDANVVNQNILEIGCAEAGLLNFYYERGAHCSGLELSDIRYNNAKILNEKLDINLFQADICIKESYEKYVLKSYDTIIIRDVIEHIENKELALNNIFNLLKPGGKLFMSFPPKYCAYAGHQQTIPSLFGKIPYLHLLPDYLYKLYLKLISCTDKKIDYLFHTKRNRISINEMDKIIKKVGFNTLKKTGWILRPAYSYRFGLPSLKNFISLIPLFNEILSNGVLYLLERKKD